MSHGCVSRRSRSAGGSSLCAASSFSGVRPQITTFAPRRRNSRVVARPMPDPPPVTSATWLAKHPGAKIRWLSADGDGGASGVGIGPNLSRRGCGWCLATRQRAHSPALGHVSIVTARLSSSAYGVPWMRDVGSKGKAIILVVDRDPHVRDLEAHFLDHAGFSVVFAENGESALENARRISPD